MGVRLRDLGRRFGAKRVLDGVTIEAPGVGWVALKGANGSGKTTLLRILATLAEASEGDAWVAGACVSREARVVRSRVGFVPASDGGFFPRLTGAENLALFGALRGLAPGKVRDGISRWAGILPVLRDALPVPFGVASSGMRQSLSLARALLHEPDVILIDEPTRSLDPAAGGALLDALAVLSRSRLVLSSSHRPEEWARADRVWELADGRVREVPA